MLFILHILKTWRRRRKYFLQCKIIIKTILWFKAIFGITYFIYWRRRKFILPCFLLRIWERGAIRKILQKKKILILSCTKNYGTPCSGMLKKKKTYSSLFWIKKIWGYSTNCKVATPERRGCAATAVTRKCRSQAGYWFWLFVICVKFVQNLIVLKRK